MKNEVVAKAEAVIAKKTAGWEEDSGYCAFTVIDENGYPTTSTISPLKANGIRRLTFGVSLSSDRAKRVQRCNRVCVCFNSDVYHISLVGTVEISTDPQAKRDAWIDGLEEYYSGADDPDFAAMHFTAERYNLFFIDGESADAGAFSKE